ncbi:MAG: hypothetical protein ACFFA8_02520 [Promethearchaeota archaeon]
MSQHKKNDELTEEEIERKLELLWKNWESRRQCEKKHIPNFVKKCKDN